MSTLVGSSLGWLLLASAVGAAPYPDAAESAFVNVKAAPYHAKGDGQADDTAALRKAIAEAGGRTVYLPDGTYRVTDPLMTDRKGVLSTIGAPLQGESRDGAVIQLAGRSPAFGDAQKGQALIATARGLARLTVDTGAENPGAIGLQLANSSRLALRDVTVRSAGAGGLAGIEIGDSAWVEDVQDEAGREPVADDATAAEPSFGGKGPRGIAHGAVWVRDVAVRGFGTGVRCSGVDVLVALENVQIEAASCGLWNHDAVVCGRDVTVTGVRAGTPLAVISLAEGGAKGLPVRATPDLSDGDPAEWVNAAQFPAQPFELIAWARKTTAEDYTAALQQAIDAGKPTVFLPALGGKKEWFFGGTVSVRGAVQRIVCQGAEFYGTKRGSGENYPGTLAIDDGAAPVVALEGFAGDYTDLRIVHQSKRTLVLRNLAGHVRYTARPGAGDLYLENCSMLPLALVSGQHVWGRFVEFRSTDETRVRNAGADLWLFGVKAKNWATLVDTRDGGHTEVHGAAVEARTLRPKEPMFVVAPGARVALSGIADWANPNADAPYRTLIADEAGKPLLRADQAQRRGPQSSAIIAAER